MMDKIYFSSESQVMLDGTMTLGKLENGLKTADFACSECVEMEGFSGTFKVQAMRDGNFYITELPRRVRNHALFREDNASLSQGQDRRWYFYFSMPEERVEELPEELVRQALLIAAKMREHLRKEDLVEKGNCK